MMLGFIIAFWATPTMTAGHLLFAVATTGYILIAIQLEEHDLEAALGDQYRDVPRRVPMLMPGLHRRGATPCPPSHRDRHSRDQDNQMSVNPTVRGRLEAQGFCGLDDATLRGSWRRGCAGHTPLGTLVTLIGVVVDVTRCAVDARGNHLRRHCPAVPPVRSSLQLRNSPPDGHRPMPRSGPQRRFVFVVATVWLIATGWAFHVGAESWESRSVCR